MSQHVDHCERVYKVATEKSSAASSPIAASWRRCMSLHHLTPEEAKGPQRLSEAEFRLVRERATPLIEEASDELDRLFSVVGRSGCCLLLTDGQGVAIDRRGAMGDDKEFRSVGLWSGTVWSEASAGTNGIGTALADERPVIIHRDQHFLAQNTGLSCATAPVRDHLGRIAAAIDVSTCREDATDMSMAILAQAVRDAAGRIEANLSAAPFRAPASFCCRRRRGRVRRFWPWTATISCSGQHGRRAMRSISTTSGSRPAFRQPISLATGRTRRRNCRMPSGPRFAVFSRAPMAMSPGRRRCSASAAPPSIARCAVCRSTDCLNLRQCNMAICLFLSQM